VTQVLFSRFFSVKNMETRHHNTYTARKNGKWLPILIHCRALESVSIASALSSALTIYPCQIRVHQRWQSILNSNFFQLGRRSGGRPQRTVYPRRLPVNTVIHTRQQASNHVSPTRYQLCYLTHISRDPTTLPV